MVILCAYICYCIHWSLGVDVADGWPQQGSHWKPRFHHGDGDDQLFSENFMEQVTNVSGIQEEDKEDS